MAANPLPASRTLDDMRGTAGGLVAGLAASWTMDRFQTAVIPLFQPSGPQHGDKTPAPEKAANAVARLVSGHDVDKRERPAAGSAVHYLVGGLSGAAYGLLAERYRPASMGGGALFGIASATLIDQIAVPLTGLARPPWQYSLRTHVYAYVSHVVFGMVTEAVRRSLRGTPGKQDYTPLPLEEAALPFALGMANGQRTMTPPAITSLAAATGALKLDGSKLAFMAHPLTAALFVAGAAAEYYVDVQPGTPDRTSAMGLGGRMAGAALSAAVIARPEQRRNAAVIGAAGAVAGALIGYRVRAFASRALGRDLPVGVAEDVLCLAGAVAITGFVTLKRRREARERRREAAKAARLTASARLQAQRTDHLPGEH
ncbi:DUF1440 domain-containing protein [Croceibacterium mercuriale]|uniref:DUF1440 domain-containing protein n=1 Tax=Croceibacterium mercuriale TaxID=1572751 RepID=UPI0009DD6C0D|nr:DUF1440 domain-containing protein [Croceibacterium mercuriale]